jgi:hypothetical protein
LLAARVELTSIQIEFAGDPELMAHA